MSEALTREKVFDVFKDFFGERRVDLDMDRRIVVHFPEVKVTNEQDDYLFIEDLYVRIPINSDGSCVGVCNMIRSSFSHSQIVSRYVHSHLPPLHNWPLEWHSPCLGSGPIRGTIASLANDPSIELWELFCLELKKFVETESITGGPYIRISQVTSKREGSSYICKLSLYGADVARVENNLDREELFQMLVKSKDLPLNKDSQIDIAMPFEKFVVFITNLFIKWYNKQENKEWINLSKVFEECKFINGNIYSLDSGYASASDLMSHRGETVLYFKDKPVPLKITDDLDDEADRTFRLLNPHLFNYIATYILTRINSAIYEDTTERTIFL